MKTIRAEQRSGYWSGDRRHFLLAAFLVSHLIGASTAAASNATGRTQGLCVGSKSTDLQTMLEKGLRARRPQEIAFVRRVVAQVNSGTLPLSVVRSSFNWARNKRPYPFPYFERALKSRAGKLGFVVQ